MTGPTTPPLRSERSRTSLVFRIPSDFGTRLASPPTAAWRTSSAAARPRSSMAALQLGCSRLAWNACRAPLRHRAHLKLFCFCFCGVGHSSKFKAMLAAMGYITPEQLAGRLRQGRAEERVKRLRCVLMGLFLLFSLASLATKIWAVDVRHGIARWGSRLL